jgi:CRP-like cAMP-binding protein
MGCDACKQSRNDSDLDFADSQIDGEVVQDGPASRENSQEEIQNGVSIPTVPKAVTASNEIDPGNPPVPVDRDKVAPATNRRAVGGGGARELKTKPPSPKDASERALMVEAFKNNKNLQVMVNIDNARCNQMIDIAWKETVPEGTEIITQGSLEADYFYIVQEGSFEVLLQKPGSDQREKVHSYSKGGSFGELALLYFAARAATVKALEKSLVWVMDRKNFKEILAKSDEGQISDYVKHLDKVEIFSSLTGDEKITIAKALQEMKFKSGETILEQGENGDTFYVLVDGEVAVIVDGKKVAKLKGTTDKAEIFGEKAILNNEPRAATIKVQSDSATTLTLDKTSFEMLLGPLESLKQRGKNGDSTKAPSAPTSSGKATEANDSKEHILRKHLKKLGLLGCGGFGAVVLVEHVKTQETYAMKALSKGYVVKCGMQKAVMSEKEIQYMCNSPFIIKLFDTYNGTKTLYFLLELALGGELYATDNKKGFHGSEKHAKFYVAGTVFAFEHLHSHKIIYRDLKPENLLLNEEGQMKLTDMGLAKVVVGKTFTTCGTPDYFAPELIKSTGHTHAVDWWALGILAYELMAGQPPFQAASPMQTYKLIQEGIKKVQFSSSVPADCAVLVKGLCERDPSERLPMRKDGSNNIKKCKWYKGFDWEKMEKCTLPAPYKPHVKSKTDAANFNARKEDMPPSVDYVDDGTGWDEGFATST